MFVSGAAGAVGSLVGQFARLRGASAVIGSAGSPEKVRWLTEELGFTAAFDYHDGPVADLLSAAAPDGHRRLLRQRRRRAPRGRDRGAAAARARRALRLDLRLQRRHAPPGPRNLSMMVANRLTLRGFLVCDHTDLRPEFEATVPRWLSSGQLVVRETVREGLEDAVPAFLDLLRGGNTGKMIVRLAEDA